MGITDSIKNTISRAFSPTGESFSTWMATRSRYRSKKQFLRLYRGLVMTCISAISEDVAKYEIQFFKKDARTGKKIQVQHELEKVLEHPNPRLSKFDLFVATQSFLELVGNAYWYLSVEERSRKVRGIYLMRPDRVKISVDSDTGDVDGYVFRTDSGVDVPLDVDEVQHFKTFNPEDEYYGIGTVEGGIVYIETEEDSAIFQRNFIKNQASPSGILTINGKIEKEQFKRVRTQWREKTEGLSNVGKTLFIRGADASFTKIGLSLGDLDMEKLKGLTEDKIMKMFRVPKIILGDTDSSGLGRGNAETSDYVFAKRKIDPAQIRLDDGITGILRRNYKADVLTVSHVSQIPEDADRRLAEDDKAVNRWMTINEVRASKGLPRVDGGDKLYVGFNLMAIDEVKEESVKTVLTVSKGLTDINYFKQLNMIQKDIEGRYVKEFVKSLQVQRELIVSKLDAYAGKTKAYDEIMPDVEDEAKNNIGWLLLLLLLGVEQGGNTALALMDVDDQLVVSEVVKKNLRVQAERVVKDFTRQTVAKLEATISEGVRSGDGKVGLVKRIDKIYDEARTSRADRLAKSESHKTINKGVQEGFKRAGVKYKTWRALGANPCEFCRGMDGKTIAVDAVFVSHGDSMEGADGGQLIQDYDPVENAHAHANCNCWLFPSIQGVG